MRQVRLIIAPVILRLKIHRVRQVLCQAGFCGASATPPKQLGGIGVEVIEVMLVRVSGQADLESIPSLISSLGNSRKSAEAAVANLPDLGSTNVVGQIVEAQPGLLCCTNLAVHQLVLPHPEHLAINQTYHRKAENHRFQTINSTNVKPACRRAGWRIPEGLRWGVIIDCSRPGYPAQSSWRWYWCISAYRIGVLRSGQTVSTVTIWTCSLGNPVRLKSFTVTKFVTTTALVTGDRQIKHAG